MADSLIIYEVSAALSGKLAEARGSSEGKHRRKPSGGSALALGIDYVPLNSVK